MPWRAQNPQLHRSFDRRRLWGAALRKCQSNRGESLNQRRILAMRAARLDALRDLTEQVHGIRITSDSLLRECGLAQRHAGRPR